MGNLDVITEDRTVRAEGVEDSPFHVIESPNNNFEGFVPDDSVVSHHSPIPQFVAEVALAQYNEDVYHPAFRCLFEQRV